VSCRLTHFYTKNLEFPLLINNAPVQEPAGRVCARFLGYPHLGLGGILRVVYNVYQVGKSGKNVNK